jgi:hypothetical protein
VQVPEPWAHPSGWTAAELRADPSWRHVLDDEDVRELDAALAAARAAGLGIPSLDRERFPLPRLAPRLARILRELEDGRGIATIEGLPVHRWSKADAALVYWGLGAHLGPAFAQNMQGDLLGHVRDLGVDVRDGRARGYQSRAHLSFHNDSTDVVGLLCLATAREGGLSRVASSVAIHDELVATRPDLAAALYGPWHVDRRGEQPDGEPPAFVTPFFVRHGGRLFAKYNRRYVETAQRFDGVAPLTATQIEALDAVDRLCEDPRFCLEMALKPGDVQFVCNHALLHSRTAYEDWPEPSRKRHLLRLWLRTPGFADRPPAFAARDRDMLAWQRSPRAPVFDDAEIRTALSH